MKNQVAIITGGCQGLGKEIATLLNPDYVTVILSNNKEELDKACSILGCEKVFCDITDVEQVKRTVAGVVEKFGRIDVLVNNAGVWVGGELTNNDYSDIAKITLVNVVGTMNITKAVVPVMQNQKAGKIVNIVSTDGLEGKTERSLYSASKFAEAGFTDSLRKELAPYNIAVIGVYPGLMNTNLFKNAGAKRDMTNAIDPVEVAKVVKFSLSTGETVLEKIVIRALHI
jgi:NADP-dependent 3-hydroxy acid dehydrogenase YdfG